MRQYDYANFWGDTVDCRQLYIGILAGSIFSYAAAWLGKKILLVYYGNLGESLIAGYGLFFGLIMAVLVAIVIAKAFKPKRIFHADKCTFNKEKFLQDYHLDLLEEEKYLEQVPVEIIQEMKQLGLYSAFTTSKENTETKLRTLKCDTEG
jgi:uncharacterized membrane protein YraQ (UPF0718 family)